MSWWDTCRAADAELERKKQAAAPDHGMTRAQFAASTIDATLWLMRAAPDRLDAWLARQPAGLLAAVTAQRKQAA